MFTFTFTFFSPVYENVVFIFVTNTCFTVWISTLAHFHCQGIQRSFVKSSVNSSLICFASLAELQALVLDNDFHNSQGISFLQDLSLISPVSGSSRLTNVGEKYTLPISESFLSQLWSVSTASVICLTHFSLVSHFYTSWKHQKTFGFLMFSGGIEMWHWTKMGE